MKKIINNKIMFLLSVFFLITIFIFISNLSFADKNKSIEEDIIRRIKLEINSPYMDIDGMKKEIDPGRGTKSIIEDGRTLIPIRALVDSLGGEINWDEERRIVEINKGNTNILLWLDRNYIYVNGEKSDIDVSPKIINSRTFTPLRVVGEALGMNVEWTGKLVVITSKKSESKVYEINPSEWGIYTDRTHSEETTLNINKAIEYAISNGYTQIKLPSGNYLINDSGMYEGTESGIELKNNMAFIMDKDTVLYKEASSSSYYRVININNKENVKVIGGKIVGDKDNHDYTKTGSDQDWRHEFGDGILIKNSRNITINDVVIKNLTGSGIRVIGEKTQEGYKDIYPRSENVSIVHCEISGQKTAGIFLSGTKNVEIVANIINSTAGTPPQSGIVADEEVFLNEDLLITDNLMHDNGYADIRVDARSVVIEKNILKTKTSQTINLLRTNNVLVRENRIIKGAISIAYTSDQIEVSNNKFEDSIIYQNGNNIIIKNNEIINGSIYLYNINPTVIVENNIVELEEDYDTKSKEQYPPSSGIIVWGDGGIIRDSIIKGPFMKALSGGADNVIFENVKVLNYVSVDLPGGSYNKCTFQYGPSTNTDLMSDLKLYNKKSYTFNNSNINTGSLWSFYLDNHSETTLKLVNNRFELDRDTAVFNINSIKSLEVTGNKVNASAGNKERIIFDYSGDNKVLIDNNTINFNNLDKENVIPKDDKVLYNIDLKRWNIYNDGTHPVETNDNLNEAIKWAASEGYKQIKLGAGKYLLNGKVKNNILLPSNIEFIMEEETQLIREKSAWYEYAIIKVYKSENVKITGGELIGDRDNHIYYLESDMESGGIDENGNLIDDSNSIRTIKYFDENENPGNFRGIKLRNENATTEKFTVYFYDKDDKFISKFEGVWGQYIHVNVKNVKVKVVLNQSEYDGVKLYQYSGIGTTHEHGAGINVHAGKNIEINNVVSHSFTGDSLVVGGNFLEPKPPEGHEYSENVKIIGCNFYNNRRQGISMSGMRNIEVTDNNIHNIKGIAPQYGIDIENEVMDSLYVMIKNNNFYENAGGDFVLVHGNHVHFEENKATGLVALGIGKYSVVKKNIINGKDIYNGAITNNSDYIKSCRDNVIAENILNNASIRIYDTKNTSIIKNTINNGVINIGGTDDVLAIGNILTAKTGELSENGINISNSTGYLLDNIVTGPYRHSLSGNNNPEYDITFKKLIIKNSKQITYIPARYIDCEFINASGYVTPYVKGNMIFNRSKFAYWERGNAILNENPEVNLLFTNCFFESNGGFAAVKIVKAKGFTIKDSTIRNTNPVDVWEPIQYPSDLEPVILNNEILYK